MNTCFCSLEEETLLPASKITINSPNTSMKMWNMLEEADKFSLNFTIYGKNNIDIDCEIEGEFTGETTTT